MKESDMTQTAFNVSYLCKPMKPSRELNKQLYQIAEPQQGLFTAQQAEDVGFIRTNHAYHVSTGDWIREERGIYRLALFPQTKDQQRVTYALWSRNRDGAIEGVFSHETALSYYELSDINPTKLHMTVPTSFRRSAKAPGVLVLYRADLEKGDITQGPGYNLTTPIRTIFDVIESGKTSFEFIEQAIDQALKKGLITRSEFRKRMNLLKSEKLIPTIRQLESVMKKAV